MATIDPSKLAPTFDDEFNTLNLAPDSPYNFATPQDAAFGWSTSYSYGGWQVRTLPTELEYYSDATHGENPFSISNGVLDIQASPAAPGSNPLNQPYDSGLLTTYGSFSQEYGYFEVRAQLPAGDGLFPAFWLLPTNQSGQAEIDVVEAHGSDTADIYTTVIAAALGLNDQVKTNVGNYSTGFHTYGVDWEPTTTTFYYDHVAIATLPTEPTANTPMYLLLNLAVGSSATWGGGPDYAGQTYPSGLLVDYVRAYATAATINVNGPAAINPTAAAAPGITGAQTISALAGTATVQPFAGLQIVDAGWVYDTVSINVSNPSHGTLLTPGGGYYNPISGTYVVTGLAATVTAAIDALVFSLANTTASNSVSTGFTVTVTNFAGTSTNAATTVVQGQAAPAPPPAYAPAPPPAYVPAPPPVSGPLNFTDNTPGDTVSGGPAGLVLGVTANNEVISTAAGATDSLALFGSFTTVNSRGNDYIASYAGQQAIAASGTAFIVGGPGGNFYALTGAVSLTSNGADAVTVAGGVSSIKAAGSSIKVTQTGGSVQLAEVSGAGNPSVTVTGSGAVITTGAGLAGASVATGFGGSLVQLGGGANTVVSAGPDTVVGGSGSLVLTGTNLTLLAGSGNVTVGGAGGAVALTGGSGLVTLADTGAAIQVNGTQGLVVTGYWDAITGGGGLLSVDDQRGSNTIAGGWGGLNATIDAGYDRVSAVGAAVVNLKSSYGSAVTGGAGLLTVSDALGGNTVNGGAGGLSATLNGINDQVTTQAGATDTVVIGASGAVVLSAGNDFLNLVGSGSTVVATGNATVSGGGGRNSYTLGGNATLASTGADAVSVTGGSALIRATGASVQVVQTGGAVQLSEGGTASVTVSGSADTITGSAAAGIVVALSSAPATVTIGSGRVSVIGAGPLTLIGAPASGGGGNASGSGGGAAGNPGTTLSGFSGATTVVGGVSGLTLSTYTSTLAVAGAQVLTVTGVLDTITGGSGLLTVADQGGFNTIVGGSGGLAATVTYGFDHLSAVGAATVNIVGAYGNVVAGGSGLLTVNDNYGGDTITGGGGGVYAQLNARNDMITTQAGASDVIAIGGGADTVNSAGNDTISVGAGNINLSATGNASITGGSGSNSYTLNGNDTLISAGVDSVSVTGGASNIQANGLWTSVVENNATVRMSEASGAATVSGGSASITGGAYAGLTIITGQAATNVTLGGGNATVASAGLDIIQAGWGSATVTATGAAVIYGGSGYLNLSTSGAGAFLAGSGSASVTEGAHSGLVQFGRGNTTVAGGAGADTYVFVNGSGGGQDVIGKFRPGQDALSFSGFSGSAVQSQTVANGALNITLTDQTHVTLTGLTQKLAL